jgi:protein-tyrosine-phosphatase
MAESDQISGPRKAELEPLTAYIQSRIQKNQPVQLTFICTHNSRRSHFAQIWAQVGAWWYGIPDVKTFSGGTEVTAFNPKAVRAIEAAGFSVEKTGDENNPLYLVRYSDSQPPLRAFSKMFDQGGNPAGDFAAVMTCTHADENCPFIPGATRISLPYEDPKASDGTPEEEAIYAERCRQIARELLFAFSQVKS